MYETRYILGKKVWKDDWKNWMLRTQRAMMMKTSEELRPYISVCANIRLPMKEAGLPLDALVAHGRSMMR
jgi:hypothetical protein